MQISKLLKLKNAKEVSKILKLPETVVNVRANKEVVEEVKTTGKTAVVNVKYYKEYDIYIGRGTKWGNPNPLKTEKERNKVIEDYIEYFFKKTDLIKSIPELKGKILGCSCFPLKCHGDFLAFLANNNIKNKEGYYEAFRRISFL